MGSQIVAAVTKVLGELNRQLRVGLFLFVGMLKLVITSGKLNNQKSENSQCQEVK